MTNARASSTIWSVIKLELEESVYVSDCPAFEVVGKGGASLPARRGERCSSRDSPRASLRAFKKSPLQISLLALASTDERSACSATHSWICFLYVSLTYCDSLT